MNEGGWRQQIEKFKQLLRVPVEDGEQGPRAQCRSQIEMLHGPLSTLLFESYHDWFDQDDEWLIQNLGQWLTDAQDRELLSALGSDDGAAVVAFLADVCVPAWRAQAPEEGRFQPGRDQAGDEHSPGGSAGGAKELVGAENTVNWNASRTPGTFYYAFNESEYVYSDAQRAPAGEWKTLPQREQDATDAALAWGTGWCTPTHGDARYGGDYVFSNDRKGPWLLREQAEELLKGPAGGGKEEPGAGTGAGTGSAPEAWGPVWMKLEEGAWKFGLTKQGPWSYTDGAVALEEQKIVDDVAAALLTAYPDADAGYVRAMAAQYVAETQ